MRRNRMNPMGHDRHQPQPQFQIQDLDRELELLQRKRQMLEQNRDPFYAQPFQNQSAQGNVRVWDAAPNNFGQAGDSYNNYEYNRGPQGHGGPGRQGYEGMDRAGGRMNPRKRAADFWQEPQSRFPPRVWDNGGNASKFGGSRPQPQSSFTPSPAKRPYFQPKKFQPVAQPRGFKSAGPRPAPRPAAAAPKPPTNRTPNKTHVKKPGFVAKANVSTRSGQAKDKSFPGQLKEYVVQPDTYLPKPVMSRIELAVGQVWKEFRDRHADSPHKASFDSFGVPFTVKNAVRDRIKQALYGKPLGDPKNVIALYKAQFPESTDEELIQLCIETEKKNQETAVREGKNVYLRDEKKADSAQNYFEQNINKALRTKICEILDKISQIYKDELPSEEEIIAEVQQIIEAQKAENNGDQATDESTQETTEENTGEAEAQEQAINDVETADGAPTEDQETEGTEAEQQLKRYESLLEKLIKRSLPRILYSFRDKMARIVGSDQEFAFAVDALRRRAKLQEHTRQPRPADTASADAPAAATAAASGKRTPRYHVMVMGVPHLPRKQRLRGFLDTFNPASIKKHRDVRNVLFVGFSEETDYQKILKKNNMVMGDNKLSIKPNKNKNEISAARTKKEAAPANTDTEANQKGEETSEQNEGIGSDDKIIDSDIDGQINDLLEACGNTDETAEDQDEEANGVEEGAQLGDEEENAGDEEANAGDEEANAGDEETNGGENGEDYSEAVDEINEVDEMETQEPDPVEEAKPVEEVVRPKRVAATRNSVAAPATPTKAAPAKATPAKATLAKATPAKATPAKATPAKTQMAKRGRR